LGFPKQDVNFHSSQLEKLSLFHGLVGQRASYLLKLFLLYKINVNLVSLWIIYNKPVFLRRELTPNSDEHTQLRQHMWNKWS
jgi:hypothetical protein